MTYRIRMFSFNFFSDNNECLTNPCHSVANCTNTIGSFKCECPPEGYSGNGFNCQGMFPPKLVMMFQMDARL